VAPDTPPLHSGRQCGAGDASVVQEMPLRRRGITVLQGMSPCSVGANVSPATSMCCCGRHCVPGVTNVALGTPPAQGVPLWRTGRQCGALDATLAPGTLNWPKPYCLSGDTTVVLGTSLFPPTRFSGIMVHGPEPR
jgi:hypothetical protein